MKKRMLPYLFLFCLILLSATEAEKKYRLMEFRNANIQSVLNYISDLTGMTIISNPELKGNVTIINKDELSLNQVIEILYTSLKDLGYTIERRDNILTIVPLSKEGVKTEIRTDENLDSLPEGDQVITQIITLKYLNVESVINNIKPFLSKFSSYSINKTMNKIIITDSASNIKKIFKIIKELDKLETSQGMETEIIYLKHISIDKMEKIILDGYLDIKIIDTSYPAIQKLSPKSGEKKEPSLKLIKLTEANAFLVIGSKEELNGIRDFIKKIDIEILPSGELQISVIPLKYINPQKMIELLNQIFVTEEAPVSRRAERTKKTGYISLSTSAKITEFPERNALIIISAKDDQDKIKGVINVFEKAIKDADYIPGEDITKVYNLQNQKSASIVPILQSINSFGPNKKPGFFYGEQNINSIIIRAPSDSIDEIEKLIGELDKKLSQVLIKVLIVEVSFSDESKIGVDWDQLVSLPENTAKGKIPPVKIMQKFDTAPGTGLTIQSSKLNFILNALQTIGDANVLSTPHILTLDNREAMINIGKKVAFISEEISITGQNQDNITKSKKITYRDVGLKMIVKPQINNQKTVTLDIRQEVNDVEPSGDSEHPNIIAREITSTIIVGDNQTAVLGGLMSTRETVDEKRVPILGSIPLIGYFFKKKTTKTEKTELMLFITPYVVLSSDDLSKIKEAEIKRFKSLNEEQKKEIREELKK